MLARIEEVAWVEEAWLSRDGNMLVVVPRAGATTDDSVAALVEEAGRHAVLLADINRDTVLAMFEQRDGWVRAGTAGDLTAEEAGRVAERVARRAEAAAPLAAEDRAALVALIRDQFYAAYAPGGGAKPSSADLSRGIVAEAGAFLEPPQVAALEAALAAGFRPLEGEP